MEIPFNEIVTGRKCFFILPDPSLMPISFLEDFFSLGFECYYIGNDGRVPVQKKIESILKLFKDVLIFINVDYELPDFNWTDYMKELLGKKASPEQFGIVFLKRQSAVELETIGKQFFQELGFKRGYMQLEYQKKNNLEIIARALYKNQAQGRRKAIRVLCSSACTYKFFYENDPYSGSLQDISLSHFSILSEDGPLPIKLYEKITGIHFNIKGSFFHSDAILVMERPVGEKMLYVFSFVNSAGGNGLDERTKSTLVPVLYNSVSSNCMALLEKYYHMEDAPEEAKPEDVEDKTKADKEVKISAEQEMDPEIAALGEEEKEPEEKTE